MYAAPVGSAVPPGPRIAVVAWPRISNLDEFQPLNTAASLRWAHSAAN
ncbi:MAG: hypothetical protein H7A15_01980 [Sinobacteraceae bacterium]|nr:hypothetical protein [Nevskiaceae bacterium]